MKKYRVIISDEALQPAKAHLRYIADDCQEPLLAERWWAKALAKIDTLHTFPNRYGKAPESDYYPFTIRTLIVDRCLFLYRVDEENSVVRILDFRHGSQEPHRP